MRKTAEAGNLENLNYEKYWNVVEYILSLSKMNKLYCKMKVGGKIKLFYLHQVLKSI